MKIAAGTLNRRATLLAPVAGQAANGAPVTTYTAVGTRRCELLALKPAAIEAGSQRVATADVQMLMRLDALTKTIAATWRIALDGVTYDVSGLMREPHDGSLIVYGHGHVA
jgi:head-tail adaptor